MTLDIYGGRDPRDIPNYTLQDAAHLSGTSYHTLKYWVKTRPVIIKPDTESPLLSFTNVIEAYVLTHLRRRHSLTLRKIRPAINYIREHFNIEHPLIEQEFETDGTNLFIRYLDQLINASRQGQFAIPDFIEPYLKRIEWDETGRAHRFFPVVRPTEGLTLEEIATIPRIIMVDPRISFGKPIVEGKAIPTAVIMSLFQAGDSIEDIAADYDCSMEEIQEAVRYESLAA